MALGICWGVKMRGSARLRCGEEVDDPRVVEEAMKLINEFLSRVERHKSVLLSESATPFDESIRALSNWLREIRAKVEEGNNDESIANLRRAVLDIGERMLELAKRARKKWLETYRPELEELINELGSGGARLIISGEPFNKDKSFVAHLFMKHLAIEMARVAKRGNITVNITLTGLKGVHVAIPKLFGDGKLRAMQCGLMLTDGSIDNDGYPMMSTNQLWQVFAWLTAWPGKNHAYTNGLSLNDGDVSVMWHLTVIDYKGAFKNKAEVAEVASGLGDEGLPTFMLYAVLGDGYVNIKEKEG
ncbi:hypothetical protein JCM16161A_10040 [Vulcanisaeta sp. JCM 16161]